MADHGEPVAVHADAGVVRLVTRADGAELPVRSTLEHWRHPRFATAPVEEMRVTQAYRVLLTTPEGPREATLHQYGTDHPDVWRLRWRGPGQAIIPRMFVPDPGAAIAFLHEVFAAHTDVKPGRPAEVRIGDSTLLVSGTEERAPFPVFLYIYVDDVDATFTRALTAGATPLEPPAPTPYGDRRATIRDPHGNIFQIAHPG